jgi:hypothetical protein
MASISNDQELKQALDRLDAVQQRVVGARFVEHVLDLSTDERIAKAIRLALDPQAASDDLKMAQKSVHSAVLESHARCGAAGDWKDQATYFVGRAAAACLVTKLRSEGKDPAWQAALSSRMARTSAAIDSDSDSPEQESAHQFQILSRYLDSLIGAGS